MIVGYVTMAQFVDGRCTSRVRQVKNRKKRVQGHSLVRCAPWKLEIAYQVQKIPLK